jgi:hypothetical protein
LFIIKTKADEFSRVSHPLSGLLCFLKLRTKKIDFPFLLSFLGASKDSKTANELEDSYAYTIFK